MTENTPHANVKQVLHGLAIPVVLQIINTPAPEPDIQEDLAQFAAEYTKCACASGYTWSNGKCEKQSSSSSSSSSSSGGGSVSSFSCCDNMGYGCVCIDDPNRISLCSSVMSGYRAQGCDPVFTGCSGRGNANFKCQ